jgi:peptidoglycan/LPS O-acetylase OafA/YrhL
MRSNKMRIFQTGSLFRFQAEQNEKAINQLNAVPVSYSNSKVHYPTLDGLRGVAVLSVILYHVLHFRPGWMGVDLFFVLSGFLITSILIDTKKTTGYFRNFYIKRVLRIFPLYYGTLVIFFLPFLINHSDTIIGRALPYFGYVQNISFTISGKWPVDSLSPLNHFWSLAIEEQFYIFFPLLIYFVRDRSLPVICATLVLLTIACRCWFYFGLKNDIGCYVFTFCRVDGLLIGALANLYARNFKSLRIEYVVLLLVPVITIAIINMDFTNPLYLTIGFTINALFFALLLLLGLSQNTYIARLLNNPVLRHFGKYSYGLYVFHHIYFILINYTIVTRFKGSVAMLYLIPAITLAATYFTALLSFHFFEAPLLKLKKKFVSA